MLALTWPVVAAVLVGALLHASWNALVKSSGDKPLDTALVHLLGAVVALPLLALDRIAIQSRVDQISHQPDHPERP